MERKIEWPGWKVGKVLGRGGFGAVYEIERDNFGQVEKAALKVITIPQNQQDIDELLSDGYDSESITRRFHGFLESIVREYSLMQELKGNTNIVYCDDLRYIQHDDGIGWDIYIKMELLTPMLKVMPAQVSDEQVIRLGMDICNALVLCKNRGIIHRDIKPQNIFLSKDGDYKLGDFGIAKVTERTTSGTKIGTYKYMAPEVYQGKPYGVAADIYSLGLVMYWMLNEKRTPFLPLPPEMPTVSMEDDARHRRLSGVALPPPAHGSEALKRIVLKACAYDVKNRYQSASEMLDALAQLRKKARDDFYISENIREKAPSQTAAQVVETKNTDAADLTERVFRPRREAQANRNSSEYTLYEKTVGLNQTMVENGEREWERESFLKMQEGQRRERENQKRNRRIGLAAGVAAVLLAAILICGGLFADHSEEAVESQVPDETHNAETVSPEELLYQQTRAHCKELGDSGDFSGAIAHAQKQANATGDSRYAALVAEYQQMQKDAIVLEAEDLASRGQYRRAIQILDEAWKETAEECFYELAGDYRMEFGISNTAYIAAGKYNSVLIKDDGRVVVVGDDEYGELKAGTWSDIVAVSAGDRHIVGLKSNGTVVAVGDNTQGQRSVSKWSNVIAIAAGDVHTIGLLEDGTLVAAGQLWAPRCDVDGLRDRAGGKRIVSIAAGYEHTLALLEDGTVIAVGVNGNKQCQVEGWTDIAAIYAGTNYSLGLKTDGSVVFAGIASWDVEGWMSIENLAAGDYFVVGLTSEGTLLSDGMEKDIGPNTPYTISYWSDIVHIAAGHDHIVTITGEGKSRCAGRTEYGQISMDGFYVTYPRK